MPKLERLNEGCSIDESRQSVRLGLHGSDPGSSADELGSGIGTRAAGSGQVIPADLIRGTRPG